ncbi:hypothetical protein ACDH70_04440 [Xanthomonas axonopodis pv. poinsettiicola]|uniref:hypothetical protein n=1 Tax=Xanthomonas TaxID=338 RepID=UPI001E613E9D|nr:hypothetical protein [Xanthomonas codiaei]MCC8538746.1 hypothetical protein [Xanthomonas codiaei]
MVWRLLAVFAAFLGSMASVGAAEQAWPREHLSDHTSEPGEALPDFLKRAGVALHEYTRRTGNEACAIIATNGELFSIRVGTDGVQRGCAVHHNDVLPGFQATSETIHSHPPRTTRLTARDLSWAKAYGLTVSGWTLNRKKGFSSDDYAGGAGYLIDNKKLFYQSGVGHVTNFGEISN